MTRIGSTIATLLAVMSMATTAHADPAPPSAEMERNSETWMYLGIGMITTGATLAAVGAAYGATTD